MGRARGKRGDRGSGTPPESRWPEELRDLQGRGGMAPDWHEAWHRPGGGDNIHISHKHTHLHDPLLLTSRKNDYVDFHTYAEHGLVAEPLRVYVEDELFSRDDLQRAAQAAQTVEDLARSPQTRWGIHRADLDRDGLQIAVRVLEEMARTAGDENMITEELDPDGSFISQTDSDHLYALSAYLQAILQGSETTGFGSGLQETRRDHYADLIDQAKAFSR